MKYLLLILVLIMGCNVKNDKQNEVLDFWAKYCGPCLRMKPLWKDPDIIKVLAEENLKFVEIDTEKDENSPKIHNVHSIPTVIVFKNGQEVARRVGIMTKSQLIQLLKTKSLDSN